MANHLFLLMLFFTCMHPQVVGEEATVRLRLTGLFQPDRKDDLQQTATTISELKIKAIDYATSVVTFGYDPKSTQFKNATPLQIQQRIDNLVRHASQGTFTVLPLSQIPRAAWKEVPIRVDGLDCKGCSYGAYLAVFKLEGVERVTVSFKDGLVNAWIDAMKTNRAELVAALRKRQVAVREASK